MCKVYIVVFVGSLAIDGLELMASEGDKPHQSDVRLFEINNYY
jgi:hypothetical protein